MQPKLMNFGQSETYEIPELLQLDLPQSEVHSPRYKIMKVTRSAELQILIAPMFRAYLLKNVLGRAEFLK
jgi:hypothetical protein